MPWSYQRSHSYSIEAIDTQRPACLGTYCNAQYGFVKYVRTPFMPSGNDIEAGTVFFGNGHTGLTGIWSSEYGLWNIGD